MVASPGAGAVNTSSREHGLAAVSIKSFEGGLDLHYCLFAHARRTDFRLANFGFPPTKTAETEEAE
jgi:hypothetical protein